MSSWWSTWVSAAPTHYICSKEGEGLRYEGIIDRLIVPRTGKKTFAGKTFSVAGPKLLNSLPNVMKQQKDIEISRRDLRTTYLN